MPAYRRRPVPAARAGEPPRRDEESGSGIGLVGLDNVRKTIDVGTAITIATGRVRPIDDEMR